MCIKELQANIEIIQSQMDKITKKVVTMCEIKKSDESDEFKFK
jgi:hypothetical protein